MTGLPVTLNLDGVPCLVVGAGAVGARKAASLRAAGAEVTVVAPERNRPFRSGDSAAYRLVVAATNDPTVNDAVEADAHAHGAWCNRAGRPDGGDLAFAATYRFAGVVIGVTTLGRDPAAAVAVRDRIAALLEAQP